LAAVLRPLQHTFKPEAFPNLLIGLGQPDDAAVYRLSDDLAIVQTVDFFTPVVDDPYAYGAIAAANALSDIYAMGGDVLFALNIAALPEELPADMISAILQGGADKVAEAGAVIAGGHTIKDKEPKYGLTVTGVVHPSQVMAKAGAKAGDALILTKPLGVGAITTALKRDQAEAAHVDAAIASMLRLNKTAAQVARKHGARGATDITGFGLLGHAMEMTNSAGVRFVFHYNQLPFLPGAFKYGEDWVFPGGASTNMAAFQSQVTFDEGVSDWQRMLIYDPETSGGLLIAIDADKADALLNDLRAAGEDAHSVGEVIAGEGIHVTQ
jgi:selenide,water dikinase